MRNIAEVNDILRTFGEAPEEELADSIKPRLVSLVDKDPIEMLEGLKAVKEEYSDTGLLGKFTLMAMDFLITHIEANL